MFKIGDVVLYRESAKSDIEPAIIRRPLDTSGCAVLWVPGSLVEIVPPYNSDRDNYPSFTARDTADNPASEVVTVPTDNPAFGEV